MRATGGSIVDLTEAAEKRALRLRLLLNGLTPPVTSEKQRLLSYVVIEGANLWAQFCRSFYLSTALRAKDSSNQPIRLGVSPTDMEHAITLAVHACKPHLQNRQGPFDVKDEPDWQNTGHWRRAIDNLQASNAGDVYRALGFQTRALRDLPVMRNFFAHKAALAAGKARALRSNYRGLPSRTLSPAEILCSFERGRPQPVVCDWMDDLHTVISLTR